MMGLGMITVKLVTGFIALVICMKMTGAKGVSNLTPIDFIWSILLSEIMGNGLYDDKVKWYTVLFTLLVWCLLKVVFDLFMYRSDRIEILITGKKEMIIKNGKMMESNLRKNRLDQRELRHAFRKQGIFSLDEIKHAYMERDGTVTVQKKPEYQTITKGDLKITGYENERVNP